MNVASLPTAAPLLLPTPDPHLLTEFDLFDYPLAPSWVSSNDGPVISPLDCEVDLDTLTTSQEPVLAQPPLSTIDFHAVSLPATTPSLPEHTSTATPVSHTVIAQTHVVSATTHAPHAAHAPSPMSFPLTLTQPLLDMPLPPTPSDTTSASSQRLSSGSVPSVTSIPCADSDLGLLLPLRPTVGRVQKQTRRYTAPKSSRYCHLCARHQRSVSMIPCGNVELGLCQKSVCSKCIEMYHLQVSGPSWACPHCQNKCPARAKCFAYDRQTARRREKTMRAKMNSASATPNYGVAGVAQDASCDRQ